MKYTPEEVAELLKECPNQPHYIKALIGKCVRTAVLAEREACASIADAELAMFGPGAPVTQYQSGIFTAAEHIADAIRARGNQ